MSQIGKHTILGREIVSHGLNYKVTTTTEQKNSMAAEYHCHYGTPTIFKILAKICKWVNWVKLKMAAFSVYYLLIALRSVLHDELIRAMSLLVRQNFSFCSLWSHPSPSPGSPRSQSFSQRNFDCLLALPTLDIILLYT